LEFEPEILAREWIACPMDDCGKTRRGWKATEVHCSDCGDHPGVQCPACEVVIDTVHNELQDMLDAAKPPHRAAPGVYCTAGHAGKPVMVCDECKVIWSPCCGESHECGVVAGRGDALFPPKAAQVFRRGERTRVTIQPPKLVTAGAEENPLADWGGWE
jgi:hypothetical protein